MKKQILILDQQSHRGGAQRVLDVVLDSLRHEFEPLVVFPRPGPYLEAVRQRGIETMIMPLGEYRSGRKSVANMLAFALRSAYCGLKLAPLIRRRRISLVYINGPRWLLGGTLAACWAHCPSIFHLHLGLSRRNELYLASRTARHVSRIIACSRAAAASLVGFSPELGGKTTVLYNPVTHFTEEVTAKAVSSNRVGAAREFVVGIVGRVTPAKGHHVLLRALAKIPPGQKKLTLLVLGEPLPGCAQDQSYFRSLRSLPSELGITGRIVWAGFQDNPSPYYSVMDALALPSLFEEGMGLVLLEALSRGIPVIASQVGGVPELVEDGVNGFLVPPADPPSLTAALNRFLDNPPLLRKMGEAARRSVDDRFSPDTFRREIRSLVGELCSGNPLVDPPPSAGRWQAGNE